MEAELKTEEVSRICGVLSINQTVAEIKLFEAWKANRDENYPIHLWREGRIEGEEPARNTRETNRREMREGGRTIQAENSFVRDTGRIWNRAPMEIRVAPSKGIAKKLIRNYCKGLPI